MSAGRPSSALPEEPLTLERKRALFTHLAVMLNSGCSLGESLQALASPDDDLLASHCYRLLVRLERGRRLSEAMALEAESYTRTELGLIRIGEESGRLYSVISRLADNLHEAMQWRRRVIEATLYPACALVFAGAVALLMAFVLLPKLLPVITGFGVELPWPTLFLQWLWQAAPWLLALFFAAAIAGVLLLRAARERLRAQLYQTPVAGRLLRSLSLAESCVALSLLLDSGCQLAKALELLSLQSADPGLGGAFARVRSGLMRGQTLTQAVRSEQLFPPLLVSFLELGEETGKMTQCCTRTALLFRQQAEDELQRLLALSEPILMVFIGGVVGFLLLACFLPFYQLLALEI